MRVLSLGGAGAVCRHATRDLAEYSDFEQIVVGDYNVEAAEKLVAGIGDERLQVLHVNAEDYDGLVRTFREFDVILNGLPWKYDLALTRASVVAGVSGLDVSTEEGQWSYDAAARETGGASRSRCGTGTRPRRNGGARPHTTRTSPFPSASAPR